MNSLLKSPGSVVTNTHKMVIWYLNKIPSTKYFAKFVIHQNDVCCMSYYDIISKV